MDALRKVVTEVVTEVVTDVVTDVVTKVVEDKNLATKSDVDQQLKNLATKSDVNELKTLMGSVFDTSAAVVQEDRRRRIYREPLHLAAACGLPHDEKAKHCLVEEIVRKVRTRGWARAEVVDLALAILSFSSVTSLVCTSGKDRALWTCADGSIRHGLLAHAGVLLLLNQVAEPHQSAHPPPPCWLLCRTRQRTRCVTISCTPCSMSRRRQEAKSRQECRAGIRFPFACLQACLPAGRPASACPRACC